MTKDMNEIVDLIIDDQITEAQDKLLVESLEDKLVKSIGETTKVDYLIKFEEYLSEHDVYAFSEEKWLAAKILLNMIKIDKFWVTIEMVVPPKTDLRGVKRLLNDKSAQNRIGFKRLDNGSTHLRFRILKRFLDKVEQRDKERASNIASDEMGHVSY